MLNVTSTIAPALIAKKFNVETQQKEIDAFMCELDGTKGKKKLGANAILGVSMACARAGAAAAVSLDALSVLLACNIPQFEEREDYLKTQTKVA